jgi:hypothetical protein
MIKANILLGIITVLVTVSCVTNQETIVSKANVNREPIYQIGEIEANIDTNYFTLSGQLLEMKDTQIVIFGSVVIYDSDKAIAGTETDFDGHYSIQLEMPFSRDLVVEFSYLGLEKLRMEGIQALNGKHTEINAALYPMRTKVIEPFLPHCCWRIINADDMGSGQTFTSEQIRRSGVRSN